MEALLTLCVPPDPGLGTPVLGLHLYTWGLVVFAAQTISAAWILASFDGKPASTPLAFGALQSAWLGALGIVVVGNLVAVFAAAGWRWGLSGDLIHYRLLEE